MLINETSKVTNLIKKAIEYYTEHELVFPAILENGYRDFSADDIERLKKISIFSKAFKQSDEYKNLPVYKIQALLKEFNRTSGYYDIFIPAMKKLSI